MNNEIYIVWTKDGAGEICILGVYKQEKTAYRLRDKLDAAGFEDVYCEVEEIE